MACLSVFLLWQTKKMDTIKKKKPNQNRADHTFGGPLGKSPTTTESLAVELTPASASVHVLFTERIVADNPRGLAAAQRPRSSIAWAKLLA